MPTKLRIAIMSDLHAAPKGGDAASGEVKLFSDDAGSANTAHPMKGLHALIKSNGLRADFVLCPGDMTNKASSTALNYVWAGLHEVRDLMCAKSVLATVGNHDVDSRGHADDAFPREALMKLEPPFPAGDEHLSDKYWAHGYYIQDFDIGAAGSVRFLVLNSCWLHEARDELHRGVLTTYTLERIKEELTGLPKAKVNIAVCHHHPHSHSELGLGADDVIKNGQSLLDILAERDHWLVVHGHKHHAKVEYAKGQVFQAVVFAAGSFSGRLEGSNNLVSKNHFHVVEIDCDRSELAGRISSWSWVPGLGWEQSAPGSKTGFPCQTGFGYRGSIPELASNIVASLGTALVMKWPSLQLNAPEVQHLMPKQFSVLTQLLQDDHGVKVLFDDFGQPEQIGRVAT